MQIIALIIAIIFFIAGIIGTAFPIIPGALLIWLGMLIYGFMVNFTNLTTEFYIIQALAALMVQSVDYVAAAIGTKKFGGSKTSTWMAALGLLLGIIFLGIPGIIFGPFLGALAGELIGKVPINKALYSSFGTLLGLLGGFLLKFFIEALMIIWFFISIR